MQAWSRRRTLHPWRPGGTPSPPRVAGASLAGSTAWTNGTNGQWDSGPARPGLDGAGHHPATHEPPRLRCRHELVDDGTGGIRIAIPRRVDPREIGPGLGELVLAEDR